MNWSKERIPGKIPYNHVVCETPLGECVISWKGWKEHPSYDIDLDDEWIGSEYSLEEAKQVAQQHLEKKYEELKQFLNK